ncbi:MAG TPA: TetR family transcriptional regulator [Stellaceae bacterium]|nr:TetR family transcriptional regulator [Stellaceae bacterium]
MARARAASSPGGRGARPDEAQRIIDAAIAAIEREGWRRLSLAAIAAEAGLPILAVYRVFGSKQAILAGLMRRIDEKVLADPPAPEPDERPRDRLFDLMMRRFDALLPYRPAFAVLRRELPADPASALCLGAALLRSMRWMLEAADIATSGLGGALAVKLAAAAYLSAMRVWGRDDSPDLGRTMAALDAALRRIERWLAPGYRPPAREAPIAG